jgi:hypothetical protein
MEENAQLRVDKMLHSTQAATVSPRSPSHMGSTSTTNFITQNVHNYFKTDELNLYSTVSSSKKHLGSPPPGSSGSASTTGIDSIYPGGSAAAASEASDSTNRLRDNYFIKLESLNSEGQRSLNGNEFLVRKLKKHANGSESALGGKSKHHGEK